MKTSPKLRAAVIRSARTFFQAFSGTIGWQWVNAGAPTISTLINTLKSASDAAGGTGLLAALTALGMNFARPTSPEVKKNA